MNTADKLHVIEELEARTGYDFVTLKAMSNEKLEEMYWERVMNGKKPEGQGTKKRKRVR